MSGRGKPGRGCARLRLILSGSTEVTSVLRQRKYHYPTSVLLLFSSSTMSDSKRHTRERSLSGDFDVNFLSVLALRPRISFSSHFRFRSPISSPHRNIILSTMPLPVSLGGRKTPSVPLSICLRASSDVQVPAVRRLHVVTRTELRNANSACASSSA